VNRISVRELGNTTLRQPWTCIMVRLGWLACPSVGLLLAWTLSGCDDNSPTPPPQNCDEKPLTDLTGGMEGECANIFESVDLLAARRLQTEGEGTPTTPKKPDLTKLGEKLRQKVYQKALGEKLKQMVMNKKKEMMEECTCEAFTNATVSEQEAVKKLVTESSKKQCELTDYGKVLTTLLSTCEGMPTLDLVRVEPTETCTSSSMTEKAISFMAGAGVTSACLLVHHVISRRKRVNAVSARETELTPTA